MDQLIHPPLTPEQFQEPRWARFLFASQAAAWLWLVIRLYLAYIFIPAGWHKITEGGWVFGDGAPIQGMVSGAVAAEGTPGWYVWFLENIVQPNASLFATLVAVGELAVGLGLLVGLLTGIAAFFAFFMSGNFVLAGSLGSNPTIIIFGLFLVMAWRNAGWIGLDRWFIPYMHNRFWAGTEATPAPGSRTTTRDLIDRRAGHVERRRPPGEAAAGEWCRLVQRVAVARGEDPDRAMRHEVERVGDERVHPVLRRRELDDGALGRREVDRL